MRRDRADVRHLHHILEELFSGRSVVSVSTPSLVFAVAAPFCSLGRRMDPTVTVAFCGRGALSFSHRRVGDGLILAAARGVVPRVRKCDPLPDCSLPLCGLRTSSQTRGHDAFRRERARRCIPLCGLAPLALGFFRACVLRASADLLPTDTRLVCLGHRQRRLIDFTTYVFFYVASYAFIDYSQLSSVH